MKTATAPQTKLLLAFDETASLRRQVRDLESEREALRDQVLELQRAAEAGLLTAGLAHDLLNQLAALMGAAELALMQGGSDAQREGLRTGLRQGARMNETIDAFLHFVRRRDGRARVFDVAGALESVARLVQPPARAQGVEFMSNCATRALLCADRQLLEQAFVNLAMNAVRAASAGGGRVVASATDGPAGFVRVTIRDTGAGVRADVRARLFEPFATGHAASGGTGLGLYVARQIVQRCGGTIRLETSSCGTRVEIDLPTAPA